MSDRPRFPIMAALYHPPGGMIRHDAVVWGYARACDRMGIEIHPYTEVTGIRVEKRNRAQSVVTYARRDRRRHGAECHRGLGVHGCQDGRRDAAHRDAIRCRPASPNRSSRFWIKSSSRRALHVYVNQTDKGELVIGAEIDPYQSYSMKGTLPTLEQMAVYTLELFPQLARIARAAAMGRHLRYDSGLRADHRSRADEVENFYMDVGWGTYGFKAGPIAGQVHGGVDRDGQDADAD